MGWASYLNTGQADTAAAGGWAASAAKSRARKVALTSMGGSATPDNSLDAQTERSSSQLDSALATGNVFGTDAAKKLGADALGLVSGAMNWIGRPASAVTGALLGVPTGTSGTNAADALTKGTKFSFTDDGQLYHQNNGDNWANRAVKGTLGFLADTAADPLSYLTFGGAGLTRQSASLALGHAVEGAAAKRLSEDALVGLAKNVPHVQQSEKGLAALHSELLGKGLTDDAAKAIVDERRAATLVDPLHKVGAKHVGDTAGAAFTEGGPAAVKAYIDGLFGDQAGAVWKSLPHNLRGGVQVRANPLGSKTVAGTGFGSWGAFDSAKAKALSRVREAAGGPAGLLGGASKDWTSVLAGQRLTRKADALSAAAAKSGDAAAAEKAADTADAAAKHMTFGEFRSQAAVTDAERAAAHAATARTTEVALRFANAISDYAQTGVDAAGRLDRKGRAAAHKAGAEKASSLATDLFWDDAKLGVALGDANPAVRKIAEAVQGMHRDVQVTTMAEADKLGLEINQIDNYKHLAATDEFRKFQDVRAPVGAAQAVGGSSNPLRGRDEAFGATLNELGVPYQDMGAPGINAALVEKHGADRAVQMFKTDPLDVYLDYKKPVDRAFSHKATENEMRRQGLLVPTANAARQATSPADLERSAPAVEQAVANAQRQNAADIHAALRTPATTGRGADYQALAAKDTADLEGAAAQLDTLAAERAGWSGVGAPARLSPSVVTQITDLNASRADRLRAHLTGTDKAAARLSTVEGKQAAMAALLAKRAAGSGDPQLDDKILAQVRTFLREDANAIRVVAPKRQANPFAAAAPATLAGLHQDRNTLAKLADGTGTLAETDAAAGAEAAGATLNTLKHNLDEAAATVKGTDKNRARARASVGADAAATGPQSAAQRMLLDTRVSETVKPAADAMTQEFKKAGYVAAHSKGGDGRLPNWSGSAESADMLVTEAVRNFAHRLWAADDRGGVSDFIDSYYQPLYALFKTQMTLGGGPGFHIRNTIGGLTNAWFLGATASDTRLAGAVLKAAGRARTDAMKAGLGGAAVDRAQRDAVEKAFAGKTLSTAFGPVPVIDLWDQANHHGVLRAQHQLDMTTGDKGAQDLTQNVMAQARDSKHPWLNATRDTRTSLPPNASGAAQRFGELVSSPLLMNRPDLRLSGHVGETLEQYTRLTAYISGVRQYGDHRTAALMTNVSQFDYDPRNMSTVERRIFKNIFPFWVWLKNNTPLQFRVLMSSPGRVEMVNRFQSDLVSGVLRDPESDKEYQGRIPDWQKRKLGFSSIIQNGSGNHLVINSESPVNDLNNMLNWAPNPLRPNNIVSGTNPLIKMLVETGTQTNTDTGTPFKPDASRAPQWMGLVPNPFTSTDKEGVLRMGDYAARMKSQLETPLGTSRLSALFPGQFGVQDKEDRWASSWGSFLGAPMATDDQLQQIGSQLERAKRLQTDNAAAADAAGVDKELVTRLLKKGYTVAQVREMLPYLQQQTTANAASGQRKQQSAAMMSALGRNPDGTPKRRLNQ